MNQQLSEPQSEPSLEQLSEQSLHADGVGADGVGADLDDLLETAYVQELEESVRPRLLSRRSLLWMVGGLFGTTLAGTGYARFVEPVHVQIDDVALTIVGLPPALAGKRIAQISDIHVGAYFTPENAASAIQTVNQLGVDLLMLTGDFATVRERNLSLRRELRTQAVMSLVEPLRLAQMPMVAVSGNHDHWGGIEPVVRMLDEAGVRLLRNAAFPIDDGLWIAGVEDVWGGRPDLGAALRNTPANATTLLMSHSPDYFDNVIQRDAPVAVQFSGHTHGGQVRLPRPTPGPDGLYSYAPIVPDYGQRYPIGLRRVGGRSVYTNRGLGSWPIPYRFNCPPEITVFTLHPA
jgi:predicted MPP superfamily phosphohydrolase